MTDHESMTVTGTVADWKQHDPEAQAPVAEDPGPVDAAGGGFKFVCVRVTASSSRLGGHWH
jgi:hypothetical protein